MTLTLFEVDAYHKASGHLHRWHLCRPPGYVSRSDDVPACVPYLPLVAGRPEALVQVRALGGDRDTRVSVGDLRWVNTLSAGADYTHAVVSDLTAGTLVRVPLSARPLDRLLTDYVIREVVEKRVEDGAPLASAAAVWRSRAGIPKPRRSELAVPLYDPRLDMDTPVLTERYAGTGGYEGPAELKGVTKERAIGLSPMAKPTYLGVIGGLHRYGTNGGRRITGVPKAWQMAKPLALVTGTPTAGQYVVDTATGVVGTSEKYTDLRCEVWGDSPGGVFRRHIGAVVAGLALDAGLVATVDAGGIDAAPRTVGVFLPAGDSTTFRALFDDLVASVPRGAWYHDLLIPSRLIVTRLPRPGAGPSVRRYRRSAGVTPGLQPLDGPALAPAKQVTVRWARNPSPTDQTSPTADAGMAALWAQEWRETPSATDAGVAAAWGSAARSETVNTCLSLEAEVLAELPAFLAEQADPPRLFELPVNDGGPDLWVGSLIDVEDDVAGFEAGGQVVVWGRTAPSAAGRCTLYVAR